MLGFFGFIVILVKLEMILANVLIFLVDMWFILVNYEFFLVKAITYCKKVQHEII